MTLKSLSLISLALLFCAGAAYAVHWGIEEWRYRALLADRALSAGDRDSSVKEEQTCQTPSETLAFVIFGQSNAANHGETRLLAPTDTFDFYDNRCFEGHDPQFSATSNGGSPWPAFAQVLRESGETRPILWTNVAVGNTRADEWVSNTPNAERFRAETEALQSKGYRIAAFLFFQGESDRETTREAYLAALSDIANMTATLSPDTPLILSNSSICGVETGPVNTLITVRAALAARHTHIHVGPDTDALGQAYRYDGCHFNKEGLQALGLAWAKSVQAVLPPNE